jgi:hypothetical protein
MAIMQITPNLRWVQDADIKSPMILQQAWEDIDTGEIIWKNVPVASHIIAVK